MRPRKPQSSMNMYKIVHLPHVLRIRFVISMFNIHYSTLEVDVPRPAASGCLATVHGVMGSCRSDYSQTLFQYKMSLKGRSCWDVNIRTDDQEMSSLEAISRFVTASDDIRFEAENHKQLCIWVE